MKVGLIHAGSGNLKSISNALKNIGVETETITKTIQFKGIDTIILPGVGTFENAMNTLKKLDLIDSIKDHVDNKKKLIGICLGMQLLFQKSYEFGENKGIGIIKGKVLPFQETKLRVPHVGWNTASSAVNEFSKFNGDYYFVHSFYCEPKNKKDILFQTNYGLQFCSAIKKDNVYGLQFHPEKSQKLGLKLLEKIINE